MRHLDKIKKNANYTEKESDDEVVDRHINTLKSSGLPTLVVEGVHDPQFYRWMEDLLKIPIANFTEVTPLVAGNRDILLEIYKRRKEYEELTPVAFMADLDKWVFTGPPFPYNGIVWTTGYSFENDLYTDGNPESLIPPPSTGAHYKALIEAIDDFADEVAQWAVSRNFPGAVSRNFPKNVDVNYLKTIFQKEIKNDHKKNLRGKKLFEILLGFCNARNHLELCNDVFNTVDLSERDPASLLNTLIWNIQVKIAAERQKNPNQKLTAGSLHRTISKYRS